MSKLEDIRYMVIKQQAKNLLAIGQYICTAAHLSRIRWPRVYARQIHEAASKILEEIEELSTADLTGQHKN